MEDNEVVVTIPCNDHAIFADKFGVLYERIGLAWKKDKDNLERLNTPYYIAEDGQWNIPVGVQSPFNGAPVIAHRGDTIPLKIYIISLDILKDIFQILFPNWKVMMFV